MSDWLVKRRASSLLAARLSVFRVVVVNGPRQSGKSTLLQLTADDQRAVVVTLDDRETLRAARTDPQGFVTGFGRPLFIDEVQRGGDPLVLAVKADADRHPRDYGRIVLAGSSRFLTVPGLSESLAGRAGFVDLWPFSQGEIVGGNDRLIDVLFGGVDIRQLDTPVVTRIDLARRVEAGGFPEVHAMARSRDRADWFDAYLRTLLERDLGEHRTPRRTSDVGRLMSLILGRTAQQLNASAVASGLGITADTVRDYVALAESIYLHHQLPAWSGGHTARVVKRPKLHAVDCGLAAHVAKASAELLAVPTNAAMGPLFETFVVDEFAKQQTWCDESVRLYHYRDASTREIDLVLEARDGRVAAVEVKCAVDVDEHDFRHLAYLRDRLGERFVHGLVIHLGSRPMAFGDRMTALPVSALWMA
jgi:uncharacterized protein